MSTVDANTFLREYTAALREGHASLFVGAGVSRAAGYVDWKHLLNEIAQELGLDVDRESDLVVLAQFHCNQRRGRDKLNQLLINEFLENVALTSNHRLIASLPLRTIWTTNYDDLLERALEEAGKRIDVKRRVADFATTRRRTDVIIYKMHGDKSSPAEAVLTKEDYESYDKSRGQFTIALQGDLMMSTVLFVGVSFTDPNILYILGRVKQLLDKDGRKHFCVLKRPKPGECGSTEYDCRRFPHWLEDLRRYNIQPVLVDSYDEVSNLLGELGRRSHLRDVFVSGSMAEYAPFGQERFQQLCRRLGAELIRRNFNIISGFGLGVGDGVIVGAMDTLRRNDDQRLQLRPFPQTVPVGVDRAEFWRAYRERMIADAGVCVVLGGNKRADSGDVVPATGVLQEVEITRAQGKPVIPIGATGHVARTLWGEAMKDPVAWCGAEGVERYLAVLGDETADIGLLTDAVVNILEVLNR